MLVGVADRRGAVRREGAARELREVAVEDAHRAGRRTVEPGEDAQQRRLARAARPQHDGDFPLGDRQRQALEGGGVALALALFGLVLSLVFDLRDERGELFDLESQGAGPAVLRRHVRLRVLLVAAFGAIGGIVTGLLLGAVAVSLVRVTAGAAAAQPPLRLVVDWAVLAAVLAGLALAGAAVVAAVSARAAGRRWEVGA